MQIDPVILQIADPSLAIISILEILLFLGGVRSKL